ncbi:MAG: FAD-dependent tricarballylate dehydrogenase TcuA [Deltaproteobacteria bacterium]|nr:FAD-dependent tricarballylate dehydrogenase TcuA [Deltaproteobacteria bacterium]
MPAAERDLFDVIVVGAGNAAFTAALAARAAGAQVLVLEKASQKLRGGNTRFTGGIFRCAYNGIEDLIPVVRGNDNPDTVLVDPYTRADYLKDLQRVTGGRTDPVLSQILVERSYDTVRWMADLGVVWEFNRAVGAVTRAGVAKVKLPSGGALRVRGEGVVLSSTLFRLAEEAEIALLYETHAQRIVTAADGRVVGVEVRGPEGIRVLHCRALVLASGGFQASPEMRTAYLGPNWSLVKVRGTRFNTGEMIRAALTTGAQSYGEWSGCHATPIDADAPTYGELRLTDKTNRLSYPFSVMVNLDGERFVDEGEDFNLYTYAKMGREILQQRSATVLQIFDRQTVPLLETRYNTATPVIAQSLPELADGIGERYGALGFRKANFRKTLESYNAAVQEGVFNPDIHDGKRTAGLRPEKTNWATRLDEPPFQAYATTVGITFTFGGIRIDANAAVVDHLERPIPGLFATGELTGGFFYLNYPGGAGLMRGAVFGRLAGTHAAQWALDNR